MVDPTAHSSAGRLVLEGDGADTASTDAHAPVLIIGAGACGLVAALAATDAGADVVVLERDATPAGSTALSSGFIPAAGTRQQAAAGVVDTPQAFAADIQAKAKGRANPAIVATVAAAAAPTLAWLEDQHGLQFELLQGFLYPGHGLERMHAVPERTGAGLIARLERAATAAGITILPNATVSALRHRADGRITAVEVTRPSGAVERIGCDRLILACNGYGGNPELVARWLPEMRTALYAGHTGNRGDAVLWGLGLGAATGDLSGYQGHGSLAHPHGLLITWALMTEGGIQVNRWGERFSNEHQGYSEAATSVLAQPDGVAIAVFDQRLLAFARQFEDFRQAEALGAIRGGGSLAVLATAFDLPLERLAATLQDTAAAAAGAPDRFGRDFTTRPALAPPYFGIRVTGALFHTQGGLEIDATARVLRPDGSRLPNLWAGGGAARGVSGPAVDGYLSGNGLLTAVTLGRIAGLAAAQSASDP
ncbi:MAG: FAD-dependent oxidoreductase [Alphaproteobacteria bacterium]|nr:FAD-dependent oxidoreductase [Alphaproteobacteria bacterium]